MPTSERAFLALLASGLIALKGAILTIDPVPRLFMGDSGSYLWSAVSGAVPIDRSFAYGLSIPLLTLGTGRLEVLLAVQVMASAASAWLIAVALRRGFGTGRTLAALAAFAIALEPLQLAYERFVMTETAAMLALAGLVVTALTYVQRPRLVSLGIIAFLGTLLLSLRLNYLPLTWAVAAALPLLAWPRLGKTSREVRVRVLSAHLAASLVATAGAHAGYRQLFAVLTETPPAYQNATGLFALAAWAPLVKREHFPDRTLADAVLPEVIYPLSDASQRELQRWEPGGLVRTLERRVGSEREADRVARQIAWRIARDDPFGVLRLGAGTLASYFSRPTLSAGLEYDLGPKTMPGGLEGLAPFDRSLGPQIVESSPIRVWHRAALWWYPALLLCPLAAAIAGFIAPRAFRARFALLALVSGALVMTGPFVATMAVVRYLHPLAWMTVLVVAAAVHAVTALRARGAERGPGCVP